MSYAFKQCAKLAGIGESLARFYKDRYEEYFIVSSGEGRNRRYSQQTVDTLKFISRCYNDKRDHSEIVEALDSLYGVPIENTTTEIIENSKTKAMQQEDLAHSLHLIYEELQRRGSVILELQEELEGIRRTLAEQDKRAEDRARDSENRDEEIIHMMRATQQQRNKPWWKRLFNSE